MSNDVKMIEALDAALRCLGQRGAVIAHNVANLHTPGFRRSDVEFRQALAKAVASGDLGQLAELRAQVVQPKTTPVDSNGNDVNLDQEIGELIKNSTAYKTLLRLTAKIYRQMEDAIGLSQL